VRLPRDLEGLDGLIIPGGESTTISRLLALYGLLEPLRQRAKAGLPLLGTCAGAIVMAKQAIGLDLENLGLMDIVVRRNAFGRQVDSFEVDVPMPAVSPDPVHAIFIRAPIIEDVGGDTRVLARLADGTIVAAQQDNLVAISFHPELTQDTRFHEYFVRLAAERRPGGVEEGVRA
jgi:5'-phosphate synthase pdxT subunit